MPRYMICNVVDANAPPVPHGYARDTAPCAGDCGRMLTWIEKRHKGFDWGEPISSAAVTLLCAACASRHHRRVLLG